MPGENVEARVPAVLAVGVAVPELGGEVGREDVDAKTEDNDWLERR